MSNNRSQQIEQIAASLLEQSRSMRRQADSRSAMFEKQRQQTALIEECCHDEWQRELNGFKIYRSGDTKEAKVNFYKNAKHANAIIERGSRLTRECDANKQCLLKRINLTLGSNPTYKISIKPPLRKDYAANKTQLDPILKKLEVALCDVNQQGSVIRQVEQETVRRFLRDGTKICVCDSDDSNPRGVVFIEMCDVRPPGVANPKDDSDQSIYHDWLWEFGAVANRGSASKILGYWVRGMAGTEWDSQKTLTDVEDDEDFGYVVMADLMILKNQVDWTDPVGVPQSEGSEDWSRCLKMLTMKAVDSICCQYDYTVIRTIADHASTTESRGKSLLDWAAGKSKRGEELDEDGPAEHTLKNEQIELNSVASQEAAIAMMAQLQHRIGGYWEMPGFLVTGDGGSGNRANFEVMLKPLFASINYHRSLFAGVFSNVVEKIAMRRLTAAERNAIEEYIRVEVAFEPLTLDTASELCQIDVLKLESGVTSNQEIIRKNNGDPDEVCREQSDWKKAKNDQADALNGPSNQPIDEDSEGDSEEDSDESSS